MKATFFTFMASAALLFVSVSAAAQVPPAADAGLYRIVSIDYEVRGLSREFAIEAIIEDLQENLTFASEEELQAFLADQQQVLLNRRTLADAEITYSIEESDEEYDVSVTVRTEDTWNIILLPYFRYSSDDGLLLSIRLRDYNFLGTQETLGVDFDRESDRPTDFSDGEFNINADLAWPFQRYGYDWRWLIGLGMEFDLDDEETEFEIETGLDWTVPWLFDLNWTLGGRQRYTYYDPADPDGYRLMTGVELGTRAPTPWSVPYFGDVEYRPDWRLRQQYRFDGGLPAAPKDRDERGPEARYRNRLSAGRVDWINNFRRGREISLTNTNEFNFYEGSRSGFGDGWETIEFSAEIEGHQTASVFGVSGRVGGFFDLADDNDFSGRVRGIRETISGVDQIRGHYGFYTNLDLAVSVIRVRPIGELIFNVFFDTGRAGRRDDGWDDFRYAGGIELFAFPLPTRAFYIRGSIGWDLEKVADDGQLRGDDRTDIFFGLDHHY